MTSTSITVSKESKKFWESFKNYPEESIESMINRILKSKAAEDAELLTKEDLAEIKQSVLEFEQGKFYTLDEIKKEFGL